MIDRPDALAVLAVLAVHSPSPALVARFRAFAASLPSAPPLPEPTPTARPAYVPPRWVDGVLENADLIEQAVPEKATLDVRGNECLHPLDQQQVGQGCEIDGGPAVEDDGQPAP